MPDEHHVVVVGGGFAGVGCARRLAGRDGVRVTLIDRNNYHQFQPLLYQVATSQLSSSDVAFSLRKLFDDDHNVDVKMADVASVDASSRTVTTTDGQRFARRRPGPGRRLAAELLPHAGRARSTRSRSTRSTTPSACGRASSASSRRPTAIPRCSTRAR